MSLLELSDLHLDALYERDGAGLITASRNSEATPPRFHLARTSAGNRWLLRAGLEPAQRERLASILSIEPRRPDSGATPADPADLEAIRAALSEYAFPVAEYRGPALFFPDQLPATDRAKLLADLRGAPRDGPFAWLRSAPEAARPIAVVRADNGEVASVRHSARSTLAAAEAGVRTAEEYRGRGYGFAAVIAWALAIRQAGRVPLYSTSWENTASRALARRVGLIGYAEDLHIG